MYDQTTAKAQRRISDLESEVRRLRRDVRRSKPRFAVAEDLVIPAVWVATCGLVGLGISKVVGMLRRTD